MATSRTGPGVLRASRQAPLPRLPQPTRPRRIVSVPAAWAEPTMAEADFMLLAYLLRYGMSSPCRISATSSANMPGLFLL